MLSLVSLTGRDFLLGQGGVEECPAGFEPIPSGEDCEAGSLYLNLTYSASDNVDAADSVCAYCGGCSTITTHLRNVFYSTEQWVCRSLGNSSQIWTSVWSLRALALGVTTVFNLGEQAQEKQLLLAVHFCSFSLTCAVITCE